MGETKIKVIKKPKICGAIDFKLLSKTGLNEKYKAPVEEVLA
jgi:hypothetical protein